MAEKRSMQVRRWQDPQFRGMYPVSKTALMYLEANCDNAGVWVVDFDHMEFHVGAPITVRELIELYPYIYPFDFNRKWYLYDFINTQCGELQKGCSFHKSVIELLKSHKLWELYKSGEIVSRPAPEDDKIDPIESRRQAIEKAKELLPWNRKKQTQLDLH